MGYLKILAWARKVQQRLHQYAESIRYTEHRKGDQQLPPDKPVEVRGTISLDKQTMADFAAQNQSKNPTQKSIKNATWAAFYAVAAYAVVTTFMWCAMLEQNKLSKISIAQTKVQWQAQNRAWVGLSSPLALPKQLVFMSFAGSKPYTGAELNTGFGIKNFGVPPAFKAGARIELLLTENTLKLPQNEMISACSAADQVGIGENVIFPNIEITQGFEMQQNQPIALQEIQRLWAIGCISYFDQPSNSTRHTKFWIVSEMLQDNVKPSFVKRENRGGRMVDFYSLPVRGWMLLKTEAE